jgi:hypothetical protein
VVRPEDVQPSSPYRLPHWRWVLAVHLVASPRSRLRRLADGAVLRAAVYLRDIAHSRAQQRSADLSAAAALWGEGPPARRIQVEARLLAGEDDRAIAARCGLGPEVVAAYADLFYDIRPRLGITSYVLHQVIGPVVGPEGGPADPARVLKRLAYSGGPAVLDALLAAARGAGPAGVTGLLGLLLEVVDLPTVGPDALRVIMLYDRMRLIDEEAAGRSASAVFRPIYHADEHGPPRSAVMHAGVEATDVLGPALGPPAPAGGDAAGLGDGPPPTAVAASKSA